MRFRSLLVLSAVLPALGTAAPPRLDVLEAWGWRTAHDAGVAGAEFSPEELAVFLRGAGAQIAGRPPPCNPLVAVGDLHRLASVRLARVRAVRKARYAAAGRAWFDSFERRPDVVRLPDGVCMEKLAPGNGAKPKPNQTVTLAYTGRLLDGTEFARMDPSDLILVPNHTTPGLYEGIQQIAVGGSARVYVPGALLSGYEERLGIPDGASVVFEVKVTATKPTSAEDLGDSLLPPAPEPVPPPSGYSIPQLIECWGWTVARHTDAASAGLDYEARAAWLHGLGAGVRCEALSGARARLSAVARFISSERARVRAAQRKQRDRAAAALFASLESRPSVIALPSGLRYEVLRAGAGPYPRPGQVVVVDYVGRLLDGAVFDRTDNEPLHIEVGSVIGGLNEGLQHINAGGRIRLYVPPSLGYGDEDASGVISRIPGHSTLIYELTLLRIEVRAPRESPIAVHR